MNLIAKEQFGKFYQYNQSSRLLIGCSPNEDTADTKNPFKYRLLDYCKNRKQYQEFYVNAGDIQLVEEYTAKKFLLFIKSFIILKKYNKNAAHLQRDLARIKPSLYGNWYFFFHITTIGDKDNYALEDLEAEVRKHIFYFGVDKYIKITKWDGYAKIIADHHCLDYRPVLESLRK